ncbi:hypothetical protein PENTCL1PPCAC_12519, partial [Pristionchus entomophagus]
FLDATVFSKKREHSVGTTGESPEKKRGAMEEEGEENETREGGQRDMKNQDTDNVIVKKAINVVSETVFEDKDHKDYIHPTAGMSVILC